MRILLVHDFGTLHGGAEIMIWRLREMLRTRGHQVLLFTGSARPLGLPVVADETCFGSVAPIRRGLQAWNPHARVRLRRVIDQFRPDLVHVKMFSNQLSPLILPLLATVPSLLYVINYNLICPINTKVLPGGAPCQHRAGAVCHAAGCMSWLGVARAEVQRRLTDLDVFDRIVANSRSVARRLRAEGVRVDGWIHHGVATRARRPPLEEAPVVGFAGRLIWKKGVDVLLQAMAVVARELPAARLIVAGDGPERGALEALAGSLGVGGAVEFTGHLDSAALERALAPAWVQAVPSRWEEPFGLVAAEAMMRGTAVVATSGGGLEEQVDDGATGLLVPTGDAVALARSLLRLLRDRSLAEAYGAAGLAKASAELTEDRHADRMEELYREIVGGRAAGALA